MRGLCDGRVAIITGGGHGVGRECSLMLARQGASVLVNAFGADPAGRVADVAPAHLVADEIRAFGGVAAVSGADVSNWQSAGQLIEQTIDTFGRLDILVNSADIFRDCILVNMTEADWDEVMQVHLKGTAALAHHACVHWRRRNLAGKVNNARIINSTSHSGLFGLAGQTNYSAAKAGSAAFTVALAHEMEDAGYGVTVNAIAPRAGTHLSEALTNCERVVRRRSLGWVAALVAWLASERSSEINGRIFETWGTRYSVLQGYIRGPDMEPCDDPTTMGSEVHRIVRSVRPVSGQDHG